MKKLFIWILPFSSILFAISCAPTETTKPSGEADQPIASQGSSANGESAPTEPNSETPSTSSVPKELKSAGYAYFGLENAKEQAFVQTGGAAVEQDAGQQTSYLGVLNGEHTFKTVRTGASAAIGDSELIVKSDGLYTSSVGGNKLDKPSLEVPADLAPGKSWKSESSFKVNVQGKEQIVSQNMTFKAVGIEKLKTKIGDLDALKVVGKGSMKVGDRAGNNESTMWFVKDVGLVKMVSKLSSDGVDQKMTMEIKSQK